MADSSEDAFSRLYSMGHTNIISGAEIENIAQGLYNLFMSTGM